MVLDENAAPQQRHFHMTTWDAKKAGQIILSLVHVLIQDNERLRHESLLSLRTLHGF